MKNLFEIAGATIKTIMIIEEETRLLHQIKSLLEEDFAVVTAQNNREALEFLNQKSEESVDLILVNTRMPGSLHTSALFSLKPRLKKQSGGIEQFLQKPFTKQELILFVKEKMQQ